MNNDLKFVKLMSYRKSWAPIFAVLLVTGCSCSDRNGRLEKEVLSYFEQQKNPEKLKAARYLMSNMKGHYSLSGPDYAKYVTLLHELSKAPINKRNDRIAMLAAKYGITDQFFLKEDLLTLDTDYLIKHIEYTYRIWEKAPWKNNYDFDLFCEYVLPYRIENESVSSWYQTYNIRFNGIFKDIFFTGGSKYKAADVVPDTGRHLILEDYDSSTLVKLIPGEHFISFDSININKNGDKYVRIQYTAGPDSVRVKLIINHRDTIITKLNPTDGIYSYPRRQIRCKINLKKGMNSVQVMPVDQPLALDYIDIIPIEQFYRHNPGFTLTDGASYVVRHAATGNCLEIKNSSMENLAQVGMGIYSGKKNQQFNIQNSDYGFFRISPCHIKDFSKCAEIPSSFIGNKDMLVQAQFNGNPNQEWAVIPVGGNRYKIMSRFNGKCMELSKDGKLYLRNDYEGLRSQQWTFERIGADIHFDSATHVTQNSPLEYACRVKDAMDFDWLLLERYFPSLPATEILNAPTGDCREESHYLLYILRSLGIPSASDFNPQNPRGSMGHDWNAIIDNNGKSIYFQNGTKPGTGRPYFPAAKVYRRTFKPVPGSLFFEKGISEKIPVFFNTPHLKDVTTDYFPVRTVDIRLFENKLDASIQHIYLCVWNNKTWIPIAWEKIHSGTARFANLGRNAVYLPMIFKSENYMVPVACPFAIDKDGMVQYIQPDTKSRIAALLKRNKPWPAICPENWWFNGGKFQGANLPDFSDAVDLYIFKGATKGIPYILDIHSKSKFKYIRYEGPEKSHVNLAELKFFSSEGTELSGKIIGSAGSYKSLGNTREKVFDNDLTTFYDAFSHKKSWVGLELSRPEKISRIKFVPRCDGNCIGIGDTYELLYWNNTGWETLGVVIANEDSIVYNNCPQNALFLLHNKTKNLKGRIFTLTEKGIPVWW